MSILPHENFERDLTTNFRINIEQLNQFKNLLRSTGAIIAGGSVLSSFHHGSNLKNFKQYECNNIYSHDYDTYVHFDKAKNLVEGIFQLFPEAEFVNECSYTLPPYDESFFRKNDIIGRFMIQKGPSSGTYIDILVVKNEKSLVDVVKSFDLSFCKIWYDGKNIFAINPNDVLNKEGTLDPDYIKPYLEGNVFTLGRIDKYRDRGYKILINLNSPSILLQNRETHERKKAYSAEDWVLCKVFKYIVFKGTSQFNFNRRSRFDNMPPYDYFFDLPPFYRFVQLNPNSIIDLIESLAYNDFSEEEVKQIFVTTFYKDYDYYYEPYSGYINSVLNKYFDISNIGVEFEKIDLDMSEEVIENIKQKKYTRRMFIKSQFIENPIVENAPLSEFSRNVWGDNMVMGDILNIAYGGGAEESKSNRSDDAGGRKKKYSGRKKKSGSRKKKSSGRRKKSGGRRKKSGGRRKKSKK